MTTPNIDTKALRELDANATPAPWESSYFGDGQFVVRMPRDRSLRFHPRPPSGGDSLAATVYGAPGFAKLLPGDVVVGMSGHELDGLTEQEYANQRVADGQLIVALRNAAPALLDLAERAQEQAKEIERLNAGWQECLDALAIARNTLAAGADERDALRSTVQQKTEQRDALKAEVERLTAEREDLLKSRDRVIAERNEQSGLRDKLIERMTASDETWSEALGNERKLRDASEREAEENEKLRDEAQRWVDRAAYYRNLAIEAGVKREALDNEDDARLVDLWESNQAERVALKAEVATLERFIANKDAINQHLLGRERDALKAEVERLREALQSAVACLETLRPVATVHGKVGGGVEARVPFATLRDARAVAAKAYAALRSEKGEVQS